MLELIKLLSVFCVACALSSCAAAKTQQSQLLPGTDNPLHPNDASLGDGQAKKTMLSLNLQADNTYDDHITTRQQVIYSVTLEKPRYPVPGTTSANLELQKEVVANLASHESVFGLMNHENCKKHIIVSTKVLEKPSKYNRDITTERWDVDRCGKIKAYVINFIPDPNGGTFIKIPNLGKYK